MRKIILIACIAMLGLVGCANKMEVKCPRCGYRGTIFQKMKSEKEITDWRNWLRANTKREIQIQTLNWVLGEQEGYYEFR